MLIFNYESVDINQIVFDFTRLGIKFQSTVFGAACCLSFFFYKRVARFQFAGGQFGQVKISMAALSAAVEKKNLKRQAKVHVQCACTDF